MGRPVSEPATCPHCGREDGDVSAVAAAVYQVGVEDGERRVYERLGIPLPEHLVLSERPAQPRDELAERRGRPPRRRS
jgi:hypothetical protein